MAMHLDHFRDVKETFGHRAAEGADHDGVHAQVPVAVRAVPAERAEGRGRRAELDATVASGWIDVARPPFEARHGIGGIAPSSSWRVHRAPRQKHDAGPAKSALHHNLPSTDRCFLRCLPMQSKGRP